MHKPLSPSAKRPPLLILLATLCGSATPSHAASFEQLTRNTKEAESVLLSREIGRVSETDEESSSPEEQYPEATTQIHQKMPLAFSALSRSLEPKAEGQAPTEACEPLVLSRLQTEMQSLGLPSEPDAVRYGLRILREQDLIDDVTLLPLLSAFAAWESTGYHEGDWKKTDTEGRVAQIACPTDQVLEVVTSVRAEKGRKMKRRHITERIQKMSKEARILPVQITWLKALERTRFDTETPFTLPQVLKQVESAKNSSSRSIPDDTRTKIMSAKKKKSGGLSNRLALYAKYNGLQISILSDTFQKFTERMTAVSAELRIKYGDGREDEVYPLSPQEQYRMAAKMLHKEVEELKLSSLLGGRSPTFDEAIIASVETGFIHARELDAALAVDDLWNPKTPGWQKAWNITKKYGAPALILIPPPGNLWASLAVGLVEALVQKKAAKAGDGDARGISIF